MRIKNKRPRASFTTVLSFSQLMSFSLRFRSGSNTADCVDTKYTLLYFPSSIRILPSPLSIPLQSDSNSESNTHPTRLPPRQSRANGPGYGAGKRIGCKKPSQQRVVPGNMTSRQRGTLQYLGENVFTACDHTFYAKERDHVVLHQDSRSQSY